MKQNRLLEMDVRTKKQRSVQKNQTGASAGKNLISTAKTINFPSPATIYSNYPTPADYCDQATNECAIRMSIALQASGVSAAQIQDSGRFRATHMHHGSTVVHQPSAAAMADWLHYAIRFPKKMVHPTGQWQSSDFADKSGIIYFAHSHRGGDGPGHIDVLHNGSIGSGFYPNKVVWFWEFSGGSWSPISSGQSVQFGGFSRQMNPGLFGIAGLEAVEAITLGLTAVQMGASAVQQTGNLVYQPINVSRLMKTEPQPYSRKYTHKIFSAGARMGFGNETAKVTFEVAVDSNDYGEMTALIKHNLQNSSDFSYSSCNATFTNMGMYPRIGGEKDPRAWPIRVAYQGNFDPSGNGKWDFSGQFEFNAFGYFKILSHEVVDRSLASWAISGKPEDYVSKFSDQTFYTVPALPEAQRKILMQNYKNDPNYKGSK